MAAARGRNTLKYLHRRKSDSVESSRERAVWVATETWVATKAKIAIEAWAATEAWMAIEAWIATEEQMGLGIERIRTPR